MLSATEYVTPAVEIIDARIEQFDRETKAMRKVYDTISDFAANAGIVTGGRPVRPTDVDLRWVGALLHKNGVIEETGLAAGVLNHPATGVAWLANKIAPYDEQLNAGDIVLSGSFTRPATATARRQLPRRLRAARLDRVPLRLSRRARRDRGAMNGAAVALRSSAFGAIRDRFHGRFVAGSDAVSVFTRSDSAHQFRRSFQ